MGAVRLIYDENLREFKQVGWTGSLNIEGTRKTMQGPLRYCLQGNRLFLPQDQKIIKDGHRLHVDLYRSSKDDGIDFLAVDIEQGDPIIYCVQCKHPDKASSGRKRRALPVATVREIYGVAKAHGLQGCLAITSSTFSPEAKKFANLKPDEIKVSDASDILKWIQKYRWNKDE